MSYPFQAASCLHAKCGRAFIVDTGYGLCGRGEFFFVTGCGVADARMEALVVVPALNGPGEGCARRQPSARMVPASSTSACRQLC